MTGFKGSRENLTPPALLRWTRKAFWLPVFNTILVYSSAPIPCLEFSYFAFNKRTGDLPDEVGGDVGPFSSHFLYPGDFLVIDQRLGKYLDTQKDVESAPRSFSWLCVSHSLMALDPV